MIKEIALTVGCMIVSTVAATYIIREIETDFWRSKKCYADVKRNINRKFK